MKKSILKIAVFSLLAAALAVPSSQAFGQEVKKEDKGKEGKRQGTPPLHGKIASVNKTAKTITIGSSTVQITSETKIEKAGKPATLNDAAVGEMATIRHKKTDDGKLLALVVRIGPKPEGAGEAKKQTNKEGMKEGSKKEPKKVDAQ